MPKDCTPGLWQTWGCNEFWTMGSKDDQESQLKTWKPHLAPEELHLATHKAPRTLRTSEPPVGMVHLSPSEQERCYAQHLRVQPSVPPSQTSHTAAAPRKLLSEFPGAGRHSVAASTEHWAYRLGLLVTS